MQKTKTSHLHSDLIYKFLNTEDGGEKSENEVAGVILKDSLEAIPYGIKDDSTRLRVTLKSADKHRLKGIHSFDDLYQLAGNENSLIVVTYPRNFQSKLATSVIGMVCHMESVFRREISSGVEILTLRNPDLFETSLLKLKKVNVSMFTDQNGEQKLLKAHHFIATCPTTLLRTRPLISTHDSTSSAVDHNSYNSELLRKFHPESFLIAQYLERERITIMKEWPIYPSHISALLVIARKHLNQAPSSAHKPKIGRSLTFPSSLRKVIRYISYLLFVHISIEYRGYKSFFPEYTACDKNLSLEEFVGWYLP